ncbi:MAG: choice-of-anchor X domain-containing protein [Ignavibacterium sp.]|uniref:choice-of-anchor X domain-containing protein n=1 Tax=Ignavibacterium sp. TaxID=2651167 RepID=UPI00404915DF
MNFRIKSAIAIIVISSIFISCEKEFDTVIDNQRPSFQVVSVSPKDSVLFNVNDSSLVISIQFQQYSIINSVFAEMIDPSGKNFLGESLQLFDNGKSENGDQIANDKIFSNKIFMNSNSLNGNYNLKFYASDNSSSKKLVAWSTFKYRNGQSNVAPEISNALVDPDTIVVTDTLAILTSLVVNDLNGLNDIKEVFFIVYRPDGTTSGNKVFLFDDGNLLQNGDQTAGDGIYSRIISVNQTNAKGTYRFEFKAIDRGGLISNIINYSVLIQ